MTSASRAAADARPSPRRQGRQPVHARNVVATSQPLASQAGAAVFARGGNAIDAALAAAITLTVVEPTMNGIGGDAFALVWDGTKLDGLNASGRSPRDWSPRRFAGQASMPETGWDSVTVPGVVSAWAALSERYGALPFADLFGAAIRHAHDGFPVSPVIARQWAMQAEILHDQPGFEAFMPRGRTPRAGELWRFEDQASTLDAIARSRGESFYRGALAETIAAAAAANGAALTTADLAAHRCDWVQPIEVDFHGHTVHEIPPNGQGIAALMALGMLEHLPYAETAPGSAARMHLEIEAIRVAFADLQAHVADPEHMRVTAAQLTDRAYLRERARLIDPRRVGSHAPGQPPSGGTVYLCAADAQGRMVSYIQSNYRGFGSGVVVPGTGIAMHNRGSGFVTTAGHPNEVGGAKRPMHSIIPAFLSRDGKPAMAFGVMGGNMQAQGHTQMVLRRVVEGLDPQACSDAPRWRVNDAAELTLESAVAPEVVVGTCRARPQAPRPGARQPGFRQRAAHRPPRCGNGRRGRAGLRRRLRPPPRRPGRRLLRPAGGPSIGADSIQARARQQQRLEELCAASIRALAGEGDLHFRGRRLHRGNRPLPLFAPHLHPALETRRLRLVPRRGRRAGAAPGAAPTPTLHARLAPADPVERSLFDLLEQFRVEALVSTAHARRRAQPAPPPRGLVPRRPPRRPHRDGARPAGLHRRAGLPRPRHRRPGRRGDRRPDGGDALRPRPGDRPRAGRAAPRARRPGGLRRRTRSRSRAPSPRCSTPRAAPARTRRRRSTPTSTPHARSSA